MSGSESDVVREEHLSDHVLVAMDSIRSKEWIDLVLDIAFTICDLCRLKNGISK